MSEPLGEDALDFLDNDPKAKHLVKEMLAAVVDHPDVHVNSFEATPARDGFKYFLGLTGGQRGSAFQNNQRLEHNIIPLLVNRGFAERSKLLSTPMHRSGFTEAAQEWHRQYGGPGPDEVRKKLGGYLLHLFISRESAPTTSKAIAERLNLRHDKVRAQLRTLVGLGLANDSGPQEYLEYGRLTLTRPEGVRWASSGCPPVANWSSQTFKVQVEISLQLEVQTIIEQARSTGISKENSSSLKR